MDIDKFIKDNINFLKRNDVYGLLRAVPNLYYRYEVTDFLYPVINPFEYLPIIPSYTIYKSNVVTDIGIVKATRIEDFGLCGGNNLQMCIMGDLVESIGKEAFAGCPKLKKVVISKNVTKIPERCFAGCSELEEVFIPDSVKYIYKDAFEGCEKVKLTAHKRLPGKELRISPSDIDFFKAHLTAVDDSVLESLIESISLLEKFSDSMPQWFKDALANSAGVKDILLNHNIDLVSCKFEDRDVSTIKKRKDPIVSDSRYIQVWLLKTIDNRSKIVVLPFMTDYTVSSLIDFDKNYSYYKYVPLKEFISAAIHFCYIDTNTNDSTEMLMKKSDRYKNKILSNTYNERVPSRVLSSYYNYDKSGYRIPSPETIKKKLINKFGESALTKSILNTYNKLLDLKQDVEEILSRFDVNDFKDKSNLRIYRNAINIINNDVYNALDHYSNALDYSDQLANAKATNDDPRKLQYLIDTITTCLKHTSEYINSASEDIANYRMTKFEF